MEKLEKEHYYHIYNRGINSELIFKNDANKHYFLKLMENHLMSKFKILAYCLMDNHFHLVVEVISNEKDASQALSNLFNAYAKAFNKQQDRTGSLFERRFKRIKIKEEEYLKNLVLYIHKNPQNHSVVNDFKNYEFTSFHKYLSKKIDDLVIDPSYVLSLFNDKENFVYMHSTINEQDLPGF